MYFNRNEETFSITFCLEDAAHQDAVAKAVNQLSKELGIHVVDCNDNYLTIGFNSYSRYGLTPCLQEKLFSVAEEIYYKDHGMNVFEGTTPCETIAFIAVLIQNRQCGHIDCVVVEEIDDNTSLIGYDNGIFVNAIKINKEVEHLTKDVEKSLDEPYVFFFDTDIEPISKYDSLHYTEYNRAECFGLSVGYMSLNDYQKVMYWMPYASDEYGNSLEENCDQDFIETFHRNYKYINEHYLIRVLMPNEGNTNEKYIIN